MEENIESQALLPENKQKNKYGDYKDIISVMTGYGFFAVSQIGIGASLGAAIAAHAHSSQDTITTGNGAWLGALATALPFGTAWLTLPLTVKTWIACQVFRKQDPEHPQNVDCNHFLLSKMLWVPLMFAVPTFLVPLTASLLAGPIAAMSVEQGLAVGIAFFFSNFVAAPLVALPAGKILVEVNKRLHPGEEEKRSFCFS